MRLVGDRIILRSIGKKDAVALQCYANVQDVHTYMNPEFPYPYTLKDANWFIEDTKKKNRKSEALRLGIQIKGRSEVIGMIGLEGIHKVANHAEIGYWLGKPFWGRGYMSEAVQLLISYAFKEMKLNRIYGRIYSPNLPSINVLKKAGFEQEGVLKEHIRLKPQGKYMDEIRLGLLKKNWKK